MVRRLSVFMLSIGSAAPALAQGTPTAGGYCLSDPSASVVYFSEVFDTKLNPGVANDAYPIQREFFAHIKAKYGFTTNSNYPITCMLSNSAALSEANRAEFEGRMRQQQRQVVEVDWKYLPDPAAAAVSFSRTDSRNPPPPRPADHGFCVAGPFGGPLYKSDPFDAVPPVNIGQWGVAWLRFLGGKYGYKGTIQCENATLDGAGRILKAWGDGARAAGRSIVETGWKYDVAANTAPAPRVDEDREPPRPTPGAAGAASTDARKLAGKEAPAVLAYCRKDRTLSVVFDCLRVQQAVIAYRIAHATDAPAPLASLFTGDKLDCAQCMDSYRQAAWAKRQALAQRLKPPVATCVSKEFVARLTAKPFPNRVPEHYDAAVGACRG